MGFKFSTNKVMPLVQKTSIDLYYLTTSKMQELQKVISHNPVPAPFHKYLDVHILTHYLLFC